MTKRSSLLAVTLLLGACGHGTKNTVVETEAASRPYRDIPEVPTTTSTAPVTTIPQVVTTSRPAAAKPSRGVMPPRRPAVTRPRLVEGDPFDALARCESGGNPSAHSPSGRYHGAFQFDLATWRSIGETGDPHTYGYAHQKAAARRLHAKRGWSPWPACSRKLGLR